MFCRDTSDMLWWARHWRDLVQRNREYRVIGLFAFRSVGIRILGQIPHWQRADCNHSCRQRKEESAQIGKIGCCMLHLFSLLDFKGVGSQLPERPFACFAQLTPAPFSPALFSRTKLHNGFVKRAALLRGDFIETPSASSVRLSLNRPRRFRLP